MTSPVTPPPDAAVHADIRLRRVDARFTLPLDEPGVTVLFGPSGAGKTTILRCLAGLDRIAGGGIHAGGSVWDDGGRTLLPARRRGVGYLFQDLALFPHLTVEQNVGYGLPRFPRAARDQGIERALRIAEVADLRTRRPAELSGGEAQRVALARALAPGPRLLLLDEPFSGLDRPTRLVVRAELRRLIDKAGIPAIVVTHDRDDAYALADRVVVLIDGRIHHSGTAVDVFTRPATAAAAAAVGVDNVHAATITGVITGGVVSGAAVHHGVGLGEATVRIGTTTLQATLDPSGPPARIGDTVAACVRGSDVTLVPSAPPGPTPPGLNVFAGTVTGVVEEADLTRIDVDLGFPARCTVLRSSSPGIRHEVGAPVTALIPSASIHLAGWDGPPPASEAVVVPPGGGRPG